LQASISEVEALEHELFFVKDLLRGEVMKPFDSIPFRSILRGMFILAVFILPHVVQAQTQWHATVGAQSKNLGHQALAFLPNEIWIHAGDSITWTFSTDEIHTVSFLQTIPSPQIRPPFQVGCPPGPPPGITPDGSPFDGSACVNTGASVAGQTYTVTFPAAGNFKLVCLVHVDMTGVIHVLDLSQSLPHDQDFYDDQAETDREKLLPNSDKGTDHDGDHGRDDSDRTHSPENQVTAGIAEVSATAGGTQTVALMRFVEKTTVIHAGETVEWSNLGPVTAHTITFGTEPVDPMPPSANVTVDLDGARHAVIDSPADSVNSGLITASPQDRVKLPQSPLGVTRFRVTFTHPGVFPYICALHDNLGMKGKVIVLP
jgi:plastocyanin